MRTRDINKEKLIKKMAIDLVVKEGLDGFSMQKLAKAARVSPATLYIYYKDREDLILQISFEISHQLMEQSLKDFDPAMHFAEGLRVQWVNRLHFFLNYPQEMEFIEHIRYSPIYDKVREGLMKNFGEVMGAFVHNAIEKQELAKLPFEVYWSVAFAPLHQLIKFHNQGKSYKNDHFQLTDDMVMLALQLVLKALKP
jgi:TetR/AcrR family transcriptional repressor of multidrug resistance operon